MKIGAGTILRWRRAAFGQGDPLAGVEEMTPYGLRSRRQRRWLYAGSLEFAAKPILSPAGPIRPAVPFRRVHNRRQ